MNNFSEDSENVRVCRVCLIRGVKMYDLQSYPLESYFENIIGVPVISTMDLPLFLCYECATLAQKFSSFKERCLTGQAALYGILQNFGKVTEKEINKIDRQKSNLTSSITNHIVVENMFYAEEGMQQVKEERTMVNEFKVTVDIKQEDGVPSFEEDADVPGSTSDDEPLSTQKVVKSNWAVVEPEHKKKKEKRRGRKKNSGARSLLPDVDFEVKSDVDGHTLLEDLIVQQEAEQCLQLEDIETEDPEENEIKEEEAAKPKRGRRKKRTAEELGQRERARRTTNTGGVKVDDFYLEDYVTVVRLTLEEQIEDIVKRKQSHNYRNAAFQCNLCFKGFIDANAWKHHVGKHDPSAGDVECPVCKFRFPSRRALQKHAINHEKKYACNSCEYVSKTTTQAKQHQRWHKGVTYTCEYCDEVSTKWTSYLSHVRMKHPSSFVCAACGYSFVSQLGLTMHRSMMHKDLKDKEPPSGVEPAGQHCAACGLTFLSEEAYNRHRVMSANHQREDEQSKGCRVCGARFADAEEMRRHARREHARKRPKNYGKKLDDTSWPAKCEHCSVQVNSAREYWTHFRRAHPDETYPIKKDYICDICGKCFRGNAFLTYHKRTHTAERKYSCDDCGKAFFNRTNLSMHLKTHSDSRPYPCDVCFKAFKCKSALDRHYRSHTGVKPYPCEICGKAFGQSNSRKLHVRTVHLRQPAASPAARRRRRDPPGLYAPPPLQG